LAAAATVPAAAIAARRTAPAIRLIVLDVGGTIIEDRGDVPDALRSALAHHGIASTPEEISRWRGASKREMVQHFVHEQPLGPGVDRDNLTAAIYEEFTANLIAIYRTVPPIPGAEDAIRQLRERGYLVATTTGFDRAITRSVFDRLKWNPYFVATISSDDVAQGRPAPYMLFHAMEAARVHSVSEVMAVGDTPLDLQAGTNAGFRAVVGVLSGASTAEKLRREPHTHILASVADLPAVMRSNPPER
jgi:phosphonatase-like hydrolase